MVSALDVRKLRNIGIIAHIDAGKTTTTERVLFYTGETHKMGDVDEGTTVTDFDPQEQEKGITIRAAAITCRWRDIRINLIDTPGHVDFTAEVERSLRVLDGGIVVFSAMEGVEAQSETVWHQADRYRVPRLCFLNKLDRIGADFYRVYDQIIARLGAKLLPLQIPIGREKDFRGICDLVTRQAYSFDETTKGKEVQIGPIPEDMTQDVDLWRERLLETLADLDDGIARLYLDGAPIPEPTLKAAIRRATIEQGHNPVLCGSSLKYIGVQPLLDAVADYLPSPLDIPPIEGENPKKGKPEKRAPKNDEPFCGLLFKIQADQHDELGFVRIYSGTVTPQARVLNATRDIKENVTRLWHIQADSRTKLELGEAGDIVGIVGLKHSITGDTLCDPRHPVVLEKITFPKTVISMAIEPESSADKQRLVDVLAMIGKEDPTFQAKVSEETGETLISGMGELHLEVITERMRRDYRLKLRTGKPRVSFRETIRQRTKAEGECNRQLAAGNIFAKVVVELEPLERTNRDAKSPPFRFVDRSEGRVPAEWLPLIESELREECLSGGLAGYPLIDIQATLLGGEFRPGETNEQAIRFAVAHAVRGGLAKAGITLLEPIMKLEVTTPEDYLGEITSDLGARRAMIEELSMRGPLRVITARVPLRSMFGYSTTLRSLSQGRAGYSMEPLDYEAVPDDVARQML